ncbi:helix-turn-helix transcriptional regulator [Arsenicibacter rosenii]|uniref:HTH araC/xylS-type domain-containing protein n=1 Tax=Arsenicibacter rosenii TaxID=1750698 RepID=A0A1S2VMK1_9BACT|nr:AraC family transcriptional regulator [Arsenicibacter rosenii]OIN59620.1 hypothetical protein BLX24_07020 [Arsenicibacter rosenii]
MLQSNRGIVFRDLRKADYYLRNRERRFPALNTTPGRERRINQTIMPFTRTQRDGIQQLIIHDHSLDRISLPEVRWAEVDNEQGRALHEVLIPGKLCIRWARVVCAEPVQVRFTNGAGHLDMFFALSGELRSVKPDQTPCIVCGSGQHTLFHEPSGELSMEVPADSLLQFVSVRWHQDLLLSLAETYGDPLVTLAQHVTEKQPMQLIPNGLPVLAALHTVLMQLVDVSLSGCLLKLFLEAKVMELLALQLKQFQELDTFGSRTPATVTDLDKLEEVRRILQREFTRPPTLSALSRLVGLNEFKLKKGFREAYGTSVYDWVLNYRLDVGYRLLMQQQLSVSEVAYQIGYQHPAHFTTAFRKKYGIPPSQIRAV